MKFTYESELMKNQKHADVMAPDMAFEVLQTTDGESLFFSIGTDHVLYVTREVTSSNTGWTKLDLSSSLSASHARATVNAKTFAVAQNAKTLAFDLALVVTIRGVDYLYLSLSNAGSSATWTKAISWTAVPFDATGLTAPSPLTIADVYLMQIPSTGSAAPVENIFVDILRAPSNDLKILDRYYIQPTTTPHWNPHALPADLAAGSIYSCLGNRTNDYVPGIYTFGTISNTKELLFTPQYNVFNPKVAPNAARLTLPAGASSISSALNSTGVSNLFVSGTNGLYLFTPNNQADQATPVNIISNTVVAGASELAAATIGTRTAVWGVNPQGALFYVYCTAGHEATSTAWSVPVPLLTGVEGFAFYLNLNAGNNVLFAHTSGQSLVQLTQDSVTTLWSQRSILLPATAITDMVQYNTFTTHIVVTDDNSVASSNTAVTLSAISPVSVYVNNVYYLLNPTVPLNTSTDATGTLTVIQETQSIAPVHLKIAMPGSTTVFADINPFAKGMQTLGTITTGDDLGKVQITTSTGTTQSLVPSSVSSSDKNAAANAIVQLLKASSTLPADGSKAPAVSTTAQVTSAIKTAVASLVTTKVPKATVSAMSVENSISMAAGELFGWVGGLVDDVESILVQAVGDVYHFLCKIGNVVYSAILDCVAAVVQGVQFVFNQIKVAFEDLIAWLGFLFEWADIVRTHKVIKNVFKTYAQKAISALDTAETSIANIFTGLEAKLNAWAGITDSGQPMASVSSSSAANAPSGSNSPQSNWGLYHTKSNVSSATTAYTDPTTVSGTLAALLKDLETLVTNEVDAMKTAVNQVKTQVFDVISTLTLTEIFKKLLAIISDLILKTAENFLLKLVDVIKLVLTGVLDMLDATIDIPIISPMYKTIAGGDDLSFLDLVCLIGAIPVTVIYKIARGEAPYPDNSLTQSLIDAPDFGSITTLLTGGSVTTASVKAQSMSKLSVSKKAVATTELSVASASSLDALDTANAVFNLIPVVGAPAVAFFAAAKRVAGAIQELDGIPAVLRYGSIVSYFLYIAPDISGGWESASTWPVITNDVITGISFFKTWADNLACLAANDTWSNKISPCVETAINAVWLVPDMGAFSLALPNPEPSEIISYTSNAVFDLGGFITFATSTELVGDAEISAIFFTAAEYLTLFYGLLEVGVAGALFSGN